MHAYCITTSYMLEIVRIIEDKSLSFCPPTRRLSISHALLNFYSIYSNASKLLKPSGIFGMKCLEPSQVFVSNCFVNIYDVLFRC
jgi:hypothetical protein